MCCAACRVGPGRKPANAHYLDTELSRVPFPSPHHACRSSIALRTASWVSKFPPCHCQWAPPIEPRLGQAPASDGKSNRARRPSFRLVACSLSTTDTPHAHTDRRQLPNLLIPALAQVLGVVSLPFETKTCSSSLKIHVLISLPPPPSSSKQPASLLSALWKSTLIK